MPRPPRPCLDCPALTTSSRCPNCESKRQAKRNAQRTHYQGDWTRVAKATVDAWVAEHGWTCPGWQRPPHPSTDLCCDHVTPRDPTHLAVLCRSCNSRKSATERP